MFTPPDHIERFNVNPDSHRDEWLALRQRDVTASVAGALLSVSPYTSRFALWHEKAGKVSQDKADTDALIRGRVLEGPALDLLAIDRPLWRIVRPNVYLRDPAARLGATPDAYAIDPARTGFGIVQVKSVEKSAFRRGWIDGNGDVEVPLWIAVQAILEAHVAGAQWACVAAMVVSFGLELHILEIPMHPGVITRLHEEAAVFWKSIAEDNPPAPDYGVDGALIAGLYRDDNGREIDLSGDNRLPSILAERGELKERAAEISARVSEIDAEITEKLGTHERAYVPGFSVKRSLIQRKGFYVEPTEYRKLSIRKIY